MSERTETFELGGDALRLEVRLSKADVHVVASDDPSSARVHLDGRHPDRVRVDLVGTTLQVTEEGATSFRAAVDDVTVRVPAGTSLVASLGVGDLMVDVAVAELRVQTASGDVRVGAVDGRCEAKSASGDIRIDHVAGPVQATSASGDVRLGEVQGDGQFTSASGDVIIESTDGDLTLRSASGDLRVGRFGGRSLEAKTMSGDIVVDVVPGRRVRYDFKSMSGGTRTRDGRSEAAPDARTVEIRARSMSGDLVLGVAEG